MLIGVCTLELYLPGTASLKAKRRVLKPLLNGLHATFNVSAAEVDRQDVWQSAVIAVAVVSNSGAHARTVMHTVVRWIEQNYPDLYVVNEQIEVL